MNSVGYRTANNINHKGFQEIKANIEDNSGKYAAGGGVGVATFGALRNSTKIGTRAVQTINESRILHAAKKAKILKIFSKFKFLRNPMVQKIAGPLAAFAGLSAVTGSAVKIVDTCQFLKGEKA